MMQMVLEVTALYQEQTSKENSLFDCFNMAAANKYNDTKEKVHVHKLHSPLRASTRRHKLGTTTSHLLPCRLDRLFASYFSCAFCREDTRIVTPRESPVSGDLSVGVARGRGEVCRLGFFGA